MQKSKKFSRQIHSSTPDRSEEILLKSLTDQGLNIMHRGCSIYHGDLSPGCILCRGGRWICVYVTLNCSRDCFFCPQEKSGEVYKGFRAYTIKEHYFKNLQNLMHYLKFWQIKGLAVSGGEPFLVFDKTLRLVSEVRKNMGHDFYLWLYTNGDFITDDSLQRLKKAGLNEIRFDISARNYDLKPLREAVLTIDTVTVEIPAIPADEDRIIGLLSELKSFGVKHLNLHELMISQKNLKNIQKKGYRVFEKSHAQKLQPNKVLPLHGSKLSALRIIDASIKQRTSIPVNVCTVGYKEYIQTNLIGRNLAEAIKKSHETITEGGYLKKLVIDEPLEKWTQIVALLQKNGVEPEKIYVSQDNKLELHESLLKYVDLKRFKTCLILSEPCEETGNTYEVSCKRF